MTELMNDRGVCRTAPATPGLLITASFYCTVFAVLLQIWLGRNLGPFGPNFVDIFHI